MPNEEDEVLINAALKIARQFYANAEPTGKVAGGQVAGHVLEYVERSGKIPVEVLAFGLLLALGSVATMMEDFPKWQEEMRLAIRKVESSKTQ